ncbi:MAG: ATP-binding protein [Pseudomonadota bacterium]
MRLVYRRLKRSISIYAKTISARIAQIIPRGLYARSLIIIIAPMVLLQSVVAFVFMERHWQTVTQRLSTAVTRDIAAIIEVMETWPQDADFAQITAIAQDQLALNIAVLPGGQLPAPAPKPFFSILDEVLSEEITKQIGRPFWINTVGNSNLVEVRIQLEDTVLRVFARRSQTYASNTHIFLLWMVGTSFFLLVIAVSFLRNQIRPIQRLAEAAEGFGKGRSPADTFRPRGAIEVRRAGLAFIQMKERIENQIDQRTTMLSGVSHDLRTILTRFKLQLALAERSPDIEALEKDVTDMQSMLEGYMDFAKSDVGETTGLVDLEELIERAEKSAALQGRKLTATLIGRPDIVVQQVAFKRMLDNIVSNAIRYASSIEMVITNSKGELTIVVEDDGPGIPKKHRDEVFRPFYRLDEARNLDASGTGLGLSIALDIAKRHGGDITLDDSAYGGLKVEVQIPL